MHVVVECNYLTNWLTNEGLKSLNINLVIVQVTASYSKQEKAKANKTSEKKKWIVN